MESELENMGTGYLKVQVDTGSYALPIADALVVIRDQKQTILYETKTDKNGRTKAFSLPALSKECSLNRNCYQDVYTYYDVDIVAKGFVSKHIHGVSVMDTEVSILPVHMQPLLNEYQPETDVDIDLPKNDVGVPPHYPRPPHDTSPFLMKEMFIPDYITVHLGAFNNASARNVRVPFKEYVANVTSSEIFSTWPQNSIISNIHVITTFALNRVFTEWYRSRNFPFDITNSTQTDQKYIHDREIFQNISRLVDQYFNMYARRIGFKDPFFTEFCDGRQVTCPGLKQWDTVTLANQGYTPIRILHNFYPNDIELVRSNNIRGITESYPGTPLREGSVGDPVRRIQFQLNRIRVNYPLITVISSPDGSFRNDTTTAVQTFQRTFNLTPDGIVGRSTWNQISFIFVAITKLAELSTEGYRISIGQSPPNVTLSQGDRGPDVLELQFILNAIAPYYETIPTVIQDSVFGASVKNAVMSFQQTFRLTADGVVGIGTWNKLYSVYRGINQSVPVPPNPSPPPAQRPPFPGTALRVGSAGNDVRLMQSYLLAIRGVYTMIPPLTVDGVFGQGTQQSVVAFQQQFWLTPDGIIGAKTWNKIVDIFLLVSGGASVSLEYPGTPLTIGSRGLEVRLMQESLLDLRQPYPSLPRLTVDGIFGPETASAVRTFQQIVGLRPVDGIIGPMTWYTILDQRNQI